MKSSFAISKMYDFHFNLPSVLVFREEDDHDDKTESGDGSSANVKPDIEELEMLLEAYFVQVDGTLNKLCHVCSISFYSLLGIGLIGCLLVPNLHDHLLGLVDQMINCYYKDMI